MQDIEKAVQLIIAFADDNTHGYSQARRGGIDDDCSGYVLRSLSASGFDIGTATYTGNMLSPLLAIGFIDVVSQIDLKTGKGLIRGDILLRPKTSTKNGHAAFYIGNGEIIQAASDYDGKPGDSSGRELRKQAYYNSPFTHVLRWPTSKKETGTDCTAVGRIINCVSFCNRRSGPTTDSSKIGKAKLGEECRFSGRRKTGNGVWLYDTIGNWIHSKFVEINQEELPWI